MTSNKPARRTSNGKACINFTHMKKQTLKAIYREAKQYLHEDLLLKAFHKSFFEYTKTGKFFVGSYEVKNIKEFDDYLRTLGSTPDESVKALYFEAIQSRV